MKSRTAPTATTKRLCDIFHAVFIMLREGLAKRRLHFLLHQGKLATRSLRSLVSDLSHYHPSSIHSRAADAFSCRFMDPDAAIIAPREVEFSCSNTPFYAAARRRTQHVDRRRRERHGVYDAAAVARAFEILDSVPDDGGVVEEMATPLLSVLATPSDSVRQLRVTDSPFPVEEKGAGEVVDLKAEEFIRQFYEQLRRQQIR